MRIMKTLPIKTIVSEIKRARVINRTIKKVNSGKAPEILYGDAKFYQLQYHSLKPSFLKILFQNLKDITNLK